MEQNSEPEPEWTYVSEAFAEDRDVIRIYTTVAAANSAYAEQLLLDPLPQLVENIDEVTREWSVSYGWVNGHIGVGLAKPPRKILFTWTVIPSLSQVHGVLYRRPPDDAAA